jgi:endonuclease-3 related protein
VAALPHLNVRGQQTRAQLRILSSYRHYTLAEKKQQSRLQQNKFRAKFRLDFSARAGQRVGEPENKCMNNHLTIAYDKMLTAFGPQHWWPGDSRFEIMVGAVLVQNTAWRNVERAIDNLRDANLMDARRMYALAPAELAELIRPAGYNQVKAKRLRNLLKFVLDAFDGSLDAMFRTDVQALRENLLSIHGIGPETADAILLYAGGLPTFVVDTYTHRVLARHGWIAYEATYYDIKEYFESALPTEAQLYNEYHALLVRVGKAFCRRSAPKCEACPLADLLPPTGIVDPV